MTTDVAPQEVVERALSLSKADGCVVVARETGEANLRFANNTLTTNGEMRSRSLAVVSVVAGAAGTAAGVVERSGVRGEDLEDLVRASEQAARDAGPADDAMPLVEPGPVSASGWEEPPAETTIRVFEGFAPAIGAAFERSRSAGRLMFGFAEHVAETSYVGSSTGLRLRHAQPTGKLELNAKSPDFARSAWAGVGTRDFTDVDVAGLEAELATRLEWATRRVDLPAGRYETLLPPSAVADLMIYLYWTAVGRDSVDGRTVFSKAGGGTKHGETLAATPLSLRSDPAAAGVECAPFLTATASSAAVSVFDNGLPLARTDWIRDGVLTSLIETRSSAAKSGVAVTPVVDNLILDTPAASAGLDEMVAATTRGLLLTCLWYIREVDPQTLLLTGLTRDGVYLVEDGEVTGAVNNFRFNESPVDLLGRLSEAGRTEVTLPREWNDYFTRAAMPPLRIPDFNMSSVSQAS